MTTQETHNTNEDDLAVARAEAEERYKANRHSSDTDISEVESITPSKAEHRERHRLRLKKWCEEASLFERAPEEDDWKNWPFVHFTKAFLAANSRQPYDHAYEEMREAWDRLTPGQREPYEAEATSFRPIYLARIQTWLETVPLSPSIQSKGSEADSESFGDVEDSEYFSYQDNVREWRRDRRGVQQWTRYRRDYRKASDAVGVSQSRFQYFFKLPLEIRQAILKLLLTAQKEVKQMNDNLSARDDLNLPFDTRIFATNRQFLAEAQGAFYQYNTLFISIFEYEPLPLWITSPASRPISHVRRVHMWIFLNKVEMTAPLKRRLERIVNTLQRCISLAQVRLSVFCQRSWHRPEIDTEIKPALEPLLELRGVEHVVWTDLETLRDFGLHEHLILGTPEQRESLKKIMEGPRE